MVKGQEPVNVLIAAKQLIRSIFQSINSNEISPWWLLNEGMLVTWQNSNISIEISFSNSWAEPSPQVQQINSMLVASSVMEAFPGSFRSKTNAKTIGNPIREEIALIEDPKKTLR